MTWVLEVQESGMSSWVPAVRGTLNQTNDSDTDASTFDTYEACYEAGMQWCETDQTITDWRCREV